MTVQRATVGRHRAPGSERYDASGTVTNVAAKRLTYNIAIFFTTVRSIVMGYAAAKIHAPSDATVKWDAMAKFPAQAQMTGVLPGVAASSHAANP